MVHLEIQPWMYRHNMHVYDKIKPQAPIIQDVDSWTMLVSTARAFHGPLEFHANSKYALIHWEEIQLD